MSQTYIIETDSVTPISIQDLNLFVSKNKPISVTSEQVRSSLILAQLKDLAKVLVYKQPPSKNNQIQSSKKPIKIEFQEPAPRRALKAGQVQTEPVKSIPKEKAPQVLVEPEMPPQKIKGRKQRKPAKVSLLEQD